MHHLVNPMYLLRRPCRPISLQRYMVLSGMTRFWSRAMATGPRLEDENVKVGHSRFIAEASENDNWNDGVGNPGKGGEEATGKEVKDVKERQEGKLSPTSSHLFKLILPLTLPSSPSSSVKPPPTVFLLHPSQPLSHLARLIGSALVPAAPTISFRSTSPPEEPPQEEVEWSDSTDIGDFIKSAVSEEQFKIIFTPPREEVRKNVDEDASKSRRDRKTNARTIVVRVPSFHDRTHFLRRRLRVIEGELLNMEKLKRECDTDAHRGARRMAIGGFGMLITYWIGVARLTFFDYGWNVMEPITYLSGLSTVICGYLWFLYKGRELSYSAVLNQSVSTRRDSLYKSRGLDIERWIDLVTEKKALRREMDKIADDYDVRWDGLWGDFKPREKATREEDRNKEKERLKEGTSQGGTDESREEKQVEKIGKEARENLERNS